MKQVDKFSRFPTSLKKELGVTGGGAFLFFAILIALIAFVWIRAIIVRTNDHYKHELSIMAASLSNMISNTESHVYRMKAFFELHRTVDSSPKLIGSAPFDSDTTVQFSLFQYSTVTSDTSVCIAQALSLFDVAYSAHATDSTYQWSYFYDAAETYSTLYPKLFLKDIMAGTNTSTADSMLDVVFSAGGTFPVKMVSPQNNPKGELLWTTPYPDAGGAGMMVSILAPVFQNKKFVGVVGTDITMKKILSVITSQKKSILDVTVIDSKSGTIVTTVPKGKHTQLSATVEFYETLPVKGWKIKGELNNKELLRSISSELSMPLVIILIATISFIVLALLFLRRFVYPSLALAGFVVDSGKKSTPEIPESIPFVWREFFQQVVDGLNERSKLTEQLHQSQKMEAIGKLAGGVAHDFNNALGGIMGAAELLKIEGTSPDEQREYLDMILSAGDRAADLTKKLLLFSRKGANVSSAVDCLKIANDTVSLLKHTINKNISVSVENRAIQTSVIGDDSLLQHAIMNMGINASHAMPNGGESMFSLENLELDAEYCEVSPFEIFPGEYLEISIRDTGTGMPPEILSRIFEPFFTTKELGKGTGLGMAAVYGTVQEHNGAITVYSEVGAGTVFHIYLPVTTETVRREITSEPIVTGSGTILVIDDEELIRITASAMLRTMGYRVILATNGQEGVNTFAETKDEIDLIILDMIMPVMGGREAFAKLREIYQNIPILIASGFAKEKDMAELKKQGVNGILNKPFRKAELAEMVKNAIHVTARTMKK